MYELGQVRMAFLKLLKIFVLLMWILRKKTKLCGGRDDVISGFSCSCPLTGDLTSSAYVCGQ